MRVRFRDIDGQEALRFSETARRIDEFWSEVRGLVRAGGFRDADFGRLEGRISRSLGPLAPGAIVEVDEPVGGARLALLAAENPGLEPLLSEIRSRAPADLGVRAASRRDRFGSGAASDDVFRRTGLDVSAHRFRIGFSRGHLLDVVAFSPDTSSSSDERALDAANLLLPRLVGDELYDAWIGSIDVAPMPRRSSLRVVSEEGTKFPTLALDEVEPAVLAAVRGVHAALPGEPWWARAPRDEWTLLESEPALAGDYRRKDDLVVMSTQIPEASKWFLEGGRFSSVRFSRHGERFAYLKLDTARESSAERQALRLSLEEALDVALRTAQAGALVGSGLGARYVYLDLALSDIDASIRILRDTVRSSDRSRRAWLQFYDSEWSEEWVAVCDGGEAPP